MSSAGRSWFAFGAVSALTYFEMAAFLLAPVGEPGWRFVFSGLRLLELTVPVALFLSLPGWQRLAFLPGATVQLRPATPHAGRRLRQP